MKLINLSFDCLTIIINVSLFTSFALDYNYLTNTEKCDHASVVYFNIVSAYVNTYSIYINNK